MAPGAKTLYQKFQQEFLITCFFLRWFDKIVVFDLDWSWLGQVGSWDLGRKDDFGPQRFQFWGDYDIGTDHEEIGPCSVENEEVGIWGKKRCIKMWERNTKREVGFRFKWWSFYLIWEKMSSISVLICQPGSVSGFRSFVHEYLNAWLLLARPGVDSWVTTMSQVWFQLSAVPLRRPGKSVVGPCMWAWG